MRVLLAAVLMLVGTTPLGGGSLLVNAGYHCTAAFAATSGSTGYLIAGRCGPPGTPLSSGNDVPVGVVGTTLANGGVSLVRVTNPSAWTLVPWIQTTGQYMIRGSTEAPVGASVCLLDRAAGQRCGVVTAKNQTVAYPEGVITGLTRTNICVSTGTAIAFVAGDQAQGVPVGGSGCSGSTGVSYFLPVRQALSAGGLSLLTG